MSRLKIILTSIGIGILYWVVHSITSSFISHNTTFFLSLFSPNQKEILMRLYISLIISASSAITQFIAAKKAMAEDILRSFRKTIETMQLGVTIADTNGKIIYTNPAEAKMHGYSVEELLGKDVRIFAPNDLWAPLTLKEMKDIKSWHREGVNIRKDGSVFPVRLWSDVVTDKNGRLLGIVTICEDITERRWAEELVKSVHDELEQRVEERTAELSMAVRELEEQIAERNKLEDQLRHAQKMEAVGTLARGIAHDFNNILTAIIGYGTVLKMKLEDDDQLRLYVEQILASAERAATLTHNLLAFSRKQTINLAPVMLNDIVERTRKLLLRILGEDIEIKVTLTDENLAVMADTGQLEQVLINLATNARDAMPQGGTLTIQTGLTEIGEEFIKAHGYGKSGTYAMISVSDTGTGMDEETTKRIFDPFFTTKEVGKGTGLGLSIVYGIIKQHNGYMDCHSEPGRGTTFKIYLPIIKIKVEEIIPVETFAPVGGTETILFAEDDADARQFTKGVLEEFGYRVITADNGASAIDAFMNNKDSIDLLLLDIIMPKKNGREVFKEIQKIKPDIKVIFMSGYSSDFIHKKEIIEEGLAFIPKPSSPTALLRKIREVLDK